MSLTHCNGSPYLYHQCVSGRLFLCPGTWSLLWAFCSICLRRPRFISTLSVRDSELPLLHMLSKLSARQSPHCSTSPWLYLHRWLSRLSDLCSSLGNLWPILSPMVPPFGPSFPTGEFPFRPGISGLMDLQKYFGAMHGLSDEEASCWALQASFERFSRLAPSPKPRGIGSKVFEEMGSYSSSTWGLGSLAMNIRGLQGSPSSSLLPEPQASMRAYPSMKVPGTTCLSWFLLPGSFQATLRSERALTLDCSADTAEPWVCWLEGEDGVLGSGLVLEGHSSSGSLRWMWMLWEVAGKGSASSEVTAFSMIESECQWSIMVAKGDGKKQVRSDSLLTT